MRPDGAIGRRRGEVSRFSGALFALGLLFFPAGLEAGVLLELRKNGADAIVIAPGQSFVFDAFLSITGSEEVTGYDYFLEASGSGYGNFISIASRVSNPAVFPDLNSTDAAVAELPQAILDPDNGLALGASVENPLVPVSGAGEYLLASFSFSTAPGTLPGEYVITPVSAFWLDQIFADRSFDFFGAFTVTVVPEPSPGLLLAAGLGGIALLRAKRKPGRRPCV